MNTAIFQFCYNWARELKQGLSTARRTLYVLITTLSRRLVIDFTCFTRADRIIEIYLDLSHFRLADTISSKRTLEILLTGVVKFLIFGTGQKTDLKRQERGLI